MAVFALCLAMAATAYATDWVGLGSLFEPKFGKSDEIQEEVLEEIAVRQLPPAVENNGTTITPLAALADEYVYLIRLKIQAPDGTVLNLPRESEGALQISDLNLTRPPIDSSAGGVYESGVCFGGCELSWLDENPGDNVFELIVEFHLQPGLGQSFLDGVSKTLQISGIWLQTPEQEFIPLVEGAWDFEIGTAPPDNKIKEISVEGITVKNSKGKELFLRRLYVSPLSIFVEYSYNQSSSEDDIPGANLKVVMKDGATAEIGRAGMSFNGQESYSAYDCFAQPIDIEKVGHIEFGDQVIQID